MQLRFLVGPAGSGKTCHCLSQARQALAASPEGLPLLLVAPKQGTYQLEQQLLSTPGLAGYTRLSIVSFEPLARLVFEQLGQPIPPILTEEGRVMVLRALLAQQRQHLKLFRASARLGGFAQQLSQVLRELQYTQQTPQALNALALQVPAASGLSYKLQDLAALLEHYLNWLTDHGLQDQEVLLRAAADLLRASPGPGWAIEALWVDGFAEFSGLELELLSALLPCCRQATITFCLQGAPSRTPSWLSHWSTVSRNLETCHKRFGSSPGVMVLTETLQPGTNSRFSKSPVLRHLEQYWAEPIPYPAELGGADSTTALNHPEQVLRLVSAPDRETEAIVAAREILRTVRAGARYRDISVVVRTLELYQQPIRRVFSRYQIPFFLDRRETVAHHPLAELTRGAVRAAAFGWQHADWFAALKSGLVPAEEEEIDLLENEALARGWKGRVWREPIELKDRPKTEQERERLQQLEQRLERIRCAVVPAFEKFNLSLSAANLRPNGEELAAAVRDLWAALEVERRLEAWAAEGPAEPGAAAGLSVHETVWRQMNAWLDNAQLAFPRERLALREWLPILEAGLANLTVGIIPPALDQVLVGAVDRSRSPEVKFALVLGLNETVFPSAPEAAGLLSESDRLELERHNVLVGETVRRQISREKYLSYIACTRSSQRLFLSWAARDSNGAPLNPSPLVSHLNQLFPKLQPEPGSGAFDWARFEHLSEVNQVVPPLAFGAPFLEDLLSRSETAPSASLDPLLAARLYGPVLRTSVSRMEQFAACPFKFFVHSGLRAEERQVFDLDVKEQGSFQHEVLAQFHNELRAEGKRWRDLAPAEARERISKTAAVLSVSFREGLLESDERARFTSRVLAESLQDFVEVLVGWMQQQYQFDPVQVELPFGENGGGPAWGLDLGSDKRLELYGRIDRVDLHRARDRDQARCVVIDYKSSHKQLDPVLVQHGLQLQLLTYLNVLRQWPKAETVFGAARLQPAGVFYVNLRGRYGREPNRRALLADPGRARKLAYRHAGRFDREALPLLDSRPGATEGDQFNYRRNRDGQLNKRCSEPLTAEEFARLLNRMEENLRSMGRAIYSGTADVAPYRKGLLTACDQCAYQAICRIDPWTHSYRVLRAEGKDRDNQPA